MSSSEANILQGLTLAEVEARRAQGLGNSAPPKSGRSYGQIIRENLFTLVNISVLSLSLVLVLLGEFLNAFLAAWAITFNIVVSMFQEIRAKRKLDQLQILAAPKATVVRDGQEQQVPAEELVVGDLLKVGPGDQIMLDGKVVQGKISTDESALTGESDLIPKEIDSKVFSSSFCVSGTAYFVAEQVGAQSMANQLTAGARAYRRVLTPLQGNVDKIVRVIIAVVYFLEIIFLINAFIRRIPPTTAIETFIIVMGLVPSGLFLSTVVAYSLAAVRVGNKGALVQQSNAVESLAYVDVLCTDKTGTLTTNRLTLQEIFPLTITREIFERVLSAMTHSTASPNKTSEAIAKKLGGERIPLVAEIPFSSARKWSATAFDTNAVRGIYALGAPEFLRPFLREDAAQWTALTEQAQTWTNQGLRVLLVSFFPDPSQLRDEGDNSKLPANMTPLGLLALSDELRPDARETLQSFIKIGVKPKIISGDNPETVAALAKQAGLGDDIQLVSGLELEQMDEAAFDRAAQNATVFGRITPHQKEELVKSLRKQGHYVAMTGDGVNDVLSLKQANLGIAMESGSQATRNVADIVLLGDQFSALPYALVEGQRIINAMADIIKLNVAYSAVIGVVLITSVMVALFPISLQQAALANFFAVGIPAVMLAVWSFAGKYTGNLMLRVLRFILPPILVTSLFALLIFYGVLLMQIYFRSDFNLDMSVNEAAQVIAQAQPLAQTTVVTFLTFALLVLVFFVRPPHKWFAVVSPVSQDKRPALLALGLIFVYILILNIPLGRTIYGLTPLTTQTVLLIVAGVILWAAVLIFFWRKNTVEDYLDVDWHNA